MRVQDYMSPHVRTVTPDTATSTAFALMKSAGLRHLPVVKEGALLGIVTDRNLRRPNIADEFRSWHDLYHISDDIAVEDVMVSPMISIDGDADVREAAALMITHTIGSLAVTDAHHGLAGILTETDVLRAYVATIADAA